MPFAPGGPTDIMARIVATHLGEAIGGTLVVENRPGAGGNIGIGIAAHADPDGYTLLITSSAYVVNPGLYAKIPYDPYKDFAPIAELGTSPNVILVDPKLGVNSIADLVARAKANPNELNYASPGIGTTPHLSGELLQDRQPASISPMCRSPARALRSRRILCGHHAGRLRSTAAGASAHRIRRAEGARRHRRAPLVRPARCADHDRARLQGFHFRHVAGLSRTCEDAACRSSNCWRPRSTEILKVAKTAEQLRNDGFEVIANGPDGMKKRIDDEVPKWRDIITKAGIKPV